MHFEFPVRYPPQELELFGNSRFVGLGSIGHRDKIPCTKADLFGVSPLSLPFHQQQGTEGHGSSA